jgi:hypothetical protein
MREALDARAYDDVAAIASISRRLHGLVGRDAEETNDFADEVNLGDGSTAQRGSTRRRVRARRQKGAYPKFLRDGDRLVKVGWSKKEQAEYQHRAPRKAIDALVVALAGVGADEFAMDSILPIVDDHGAEVPSYQAYLGLAWLRSWGAVRRESRGGYVVHPQRLMDSELASRWQALGEAEAGGDQ